MVGVLFGAASAVRAGEFISLGTLRDAPSVVQASYVAGVWDAIEAIGGSELASSEMIGTYAKALAACQVFQGIPVGSVADRLLSTAPGKPFTAARGLLLAMDAACGVPDLPIITGGYYYVTFDSLRSEMRMSQTSYVAGVWDAVNILGDLPASATPERIGRYLRALAACPVRPEYPEYQLRSMADRLLSTAPANGDRYAAAAGLMDAMDRMCAIPGPIP